MWRALKKWLKNRVSGPFSYLAAIVPLGNDLKKQNIQPRKDVDQATVLSLNIGPQRWGFQNCLPWGRSSLVDAAGSPKIRLLNRDFGNILSIFKGKQRKKSTVFTKFSSVWTPEIY